MSVVWTNGENYILCPYGGKDHFIGEARFSTHVVKCRKSSNINLAICPYNADHRLQVSEYQHHVTICEDRILVDMRAYQYDDENSEKLYPIVEKKLSHQVESWDEDDDPSYNPEEYCISEEIVRRLDVEPGSVRKGFKQFERARFQLFAKMTESKILDCNKENNNPTDNASIGCSVASKSSSAHSSNPSKGSSQGLRKPGGSANGVSSNKSFNTNTRDSRITPVTSTSVSSADRNESVNGSSSSDTSSESNFPPLGSGRSVKGRGRIPREVESEDGWIQVRSRGRGRGRGHL